MKRKWIQMAFKEAVPVTCSYLFVSMAYGIMMEEAGFGWFWSLFTSLTVYTGAFQFVLVTFMSSGASLLTVGLTALFMNSRQAFYGLSFIEDFKSMGKCYPYMVHTMTDETYAINCSLLGKEELFDTQENRRRVMFYVALFCRISWMTGAVLGGVLGQLIPVELEGIDFCMTALFVVIFIDQWKTFHTHLPALLGLGMGIGCLLIFGAERFMLPSLLLVSGLLLLLERRMQKEETSNE